MAIDLLQVAGVFREDVGCQELLVRVGLLDLEQLLKFLEPGLVLAQPGHLALEPLVLRPQCLVLVRQLVQLAQV